VSAGEAPLADLAGLGVVVVGAGVAGLCTALELRRAGADCLLLDPAPIGRNASGVAAGMLAPGFESALDPASAGRFAILRAGRDLWRDLPVTLRQDGAVWVGRDEAELATAERALAREGAHAERLSREEAAEVRPGLAAWVAGAVFTAEDWTLEPRPALDALNAEFLHRGGRSRRAAASRVSARSVDLLGETVCGDAVIVCAGFESRRFAETAPELEALTPIRGELVRFPGAEPRDGPTVRHAAGYLTPADAGPVAGATMEPGVALVGRPTVGVELAATAASLFPTLQDAPFESGMGVRAATPDGLPLVGRAAGGVWLATGFRRNGWTLAPLAARLLTSALGRGDPGPWAEALRSDRF